jgi:hypothetical protein
VFKEALPKLVTKWLMECVLFFMKDGDPQQPRYFFSFCFIFIDAMGFSSDITSLEQCILIKRSMFLPCVVVRMGNGIFCGLVNICNGGGSWWSTSTRLLLAV